MIFAYILSLSVICLACLVVAIPVAEAEDIKLVTDLDSHGDGHHPPYHRPPYHRPPYLRPPYLRHHDSEHHRRDEEVAAAADDDSGNDSSDGGYIPPIPPIPPIDGYHKRDERVTVADEDDGAKDNAEFSLCGGGRTWYCIRIHRNCIVASTERSPCSRGGGLVGCHGHNRNCQDCYILNGNKKQWYFMHDRCSEQRSYWTNSKSAWRNY